VRSPERILVLCEHSRAGDAAIDVARDVVATGDAMLTVVAVSPQAPSGPRCGNSAAQYNEIVAESVRKDLDQARLRLGRLANSATFVLLVEGVDQTFEQFVRSGGFARVVLPARHRPLRRAPYHPEAARLTLSAGAEIRIVEAASRRRSPRHDDGAG
jgi:nucleotide-binding universal stress UspA family protein